MTPGRGIRQGDPLSPYLFVLCMDTLSHLISHQVDSGGWIPPKAGRNGPDISHLMFADDLLHFCRASSDQMQCVMDVLDHFCSLLGQQISIEKTSILFSNNVSAETRRNLVQLLGFREVSSLSKYLGVPLSGRSPKKKLIFNISLIRSNPSYPVGKQSSFVLRGGLPYLKL